MKSPFPGMDPYLEQYWGDVQTSMAVYLRDQLRPQLPADLVIRVEEYISVEQDEHSPFGYVPDVYVVEEPGGRGKRRASASAVATRTKSQPFVVRMRLERRKLRSVRIFDTGSGNRIVTAIELISPSNKVGQKGRKAYEKKRNDLLADQRVNLIEIDLLRTGAPILLVGDYQVPEEFREPYRVSVFRAAKKRQCEFYQAGFRSRLPVIPIPLRARDKDVALDVQALVSQCYENGDYGRTIDYRRDPNPPLQKDDVTWANSWLKKAGRR